MVERWWTRAPLWLRLSFLFGMMTTVPLLVSGILLSVRGWNGILGSGNAVAEAGRRALSDAATAFNEQSSKQFQRAADTMVESSQRHLKTTSDEAARVSNDSLDESTTRMSERVEKSVGKGIHGLLKVSETALSQSLQEQQRANTGALDGLSNTFKKNMEARLAQTTPRLEGDLRKSFDRLWEAPADRRAASVLDYTETFTAELILRLQPAILSVGIRDRDGARPILNRLLKNPTARPNIVRAVLVSETGDEWTRVPDTEAAIGDEDWEATPTRHRLFESSSPWIREPVRWDERSRHWIIRVAHKLPLSQDAVMDSDEATRLALKTPTSFVVVDFEVEHVVEPARVDAPPGMELLVVEGVDGKVVSSTIPDQINNPARAILERLPKKKDADEYARKSFFFTYTTADGFRRHGAARYWKDLGGCWSVVVQSDEEIYRPVREFQEGITTSWKDAVAAVGGEARVLTQTDQERAKRANRQLLASAHDRMVAQGDKLVTEVASHLKVERAQHLPVARRQLHATLRKVARDVAVQMKTDAATGAARAQNEMRKSLDLKTNSFTYQMEQAAAQRAGRVARQLQVFSAGLIPLALLLALGLATLTARSLVRPINRLVKSTQALAAGDYSERTAVRGDDELARLSRAFNDMADAIQVGQAELQQSHDTLAAEKARIEAIANSSPDGLVMLESSGHVAFLNPSAIRLLHLPAENLPGAPFEIGALPTEGAEVLRRCLAAAAEEGGAHEFEFEAPQRQILQLREVQVRTPGGRSYGRLLHIHDITRERIIDEMKSDFISLVSHELRTPLTSILGFSSYILTGRLGPVSEGQRPALESVHRQARRLSAIISDFLDVSRIESGKIEMKKEPVSVRGIADRVIEDLRPQAAERSIQVATWTEEDPALLTALGDEPRIAQVFTNLISNALKFTDREGHIDVLLARENGSVLCRVRDSGCGIPADELDKVFDRFYQVEKVVTRKTGGTGLGLAIVKNIVEAHGGRIWIESELGSGTQVSFTLPGAS